MHRALLGIAIAAFGCCPKQPVRVIPASVTAYESRGYAYAKQTDGSYIVYTTTDKALPEIRHEIGCPCIEERTGTTYLLIPAKLD